MDPEVKQRLRTAAAEARRRYPGAVGELLSQELLSWMVFGHLIGSTLILRVADDLTDAPTDDLPRQRVGGAQWAASSQLRP